MGCDICEGKMKENIIYENDKMIIVLADNPCISGHLQIFPKRHITIMEQLSEEESAYIINAANKTSMILFEALKVHGTNIIVQNGIPAGQTIPHFSIHVIPRRTDDGLSLDWDMKQASNESLDSMYRLISEGMVYEIKQNEIEQKTPAEKLHEYRPTDTIPKDIVNENSENNEEDTTSSRINRSTDYEEENIRKESKKTNYWLKSLERIP